MLQACSVNGIEKRYHQMMGIEEDAKKMNVLSNVLTFALLIIACLGLTGVIRNPTLGWTTLGIGAATAALHLWGGNCSKRKFDLISWGAIATAFITVGALGGKGIMNAQLVGYTVLGICGASFIFYALVLRGVAAKKLRDEQSFQI